MIDEGTRGGRGRRLCVGRGFCCACNVGNLGAVMDCHSVINNSLGGFLMSRGICREGNFLVLGGWVVPCSFFFFL